jgi:hypothetical protein
MFDTYIVTNLHTLTHSHTHTHNPGGDSTPAALLAHTTQSPLKGRKARQTLITRCQNHAQASSLNHFCARSGWRRPSTTHSLTPSHRSHLMHEEQHSNACCYFHPPASSSRGLPTATDRREHPTVSVVGTSLSSHTTHTHPPTLHTQCKQPLPSRVDSLPHAVSHACFSDNKAAMMLAASALQAGNPAQAQSTLPTRYPHIVPERAMFN